MFNCIFAHDVKQGGRSKNQGEIDGFRDVVSRCGLRSIWFGGRPFTWTNNRVEHENTQERLDRTFMTDAWYAKFPCTKTKHLPKRRSED